MPLVYGVVRDFLLYLISLAQRIILGFSLMCLIWTMCYFCVCMCLRNLLGELWGRHLYSDTVCAPWFVTGSWRSDAGTSEGSFWSHEWKGTPLMGLEVLELVLNIFPPLVEFHLLHILENTISKVLSSVQGSFPVLLMKLWNIENLGCGRWLDRKHYSIHSLPPSLQKCLLRFQYISSYRRVEERWFWRDWRLRVWTKFIQVLEVWVLLDYFRYSDTE